jgi:glucose-6-phosphate isomerase
LYPEFGVTPGVPICEQYARDPARFDRIPNPETKAGLWEDFVP